ncbi:CotD family spore coat protein [Virgibacillus halophilus]|uniref:CotD family spore coat protein n=1 Tax=Tigheibacillus halophilus TaxID=361280 RepID=A0ABU5C6X6_9BACI|nr:CotD family spore coat protein [Virgibacillus halophilus]
MGSYRQSNNQHSQQNTSANNNHNCNCHHSNRNNCNCRGKEEVVVDPTRTIVNTNTRKRVVKHVHPTEVINVNRTVVRNEHFFQSVKEKSMKQSKKIIIAAKTLKDEAIADHFGADSSLLRTKLSLRGKLFLLAT